MASSAGNSENAYQERAPIKVVLPQIIAVMVKNVLLFTIGMCTAYPTILIPALTHPQTDSPFKLDKEGISWISSTNLVCALIGCCLSGVSTRHIGRRRFMQLVTVPLMISWLIFRFADKIWQIYFALALTGLASGLIEAPVLSYVAEITQPGLRGMLSATGTLSSVLGVLVEFLLGTFLTWRCVAVTSSIAPLVALFLIYFIPESPHWLMMHKKLLDAQKSLAWLRGWKSLEDVKEEFLELCRNFNINEISEIDSNVFTTAYDTSNVKPYFNMQMIKPYLKRNFIWPFSLVLFIYFLSAFTGYLTLQTYAVSIFTTLRVPMNEYYATLGLGIAQFIGSGTSVILVKYFGKRVMTFISLVCVGICNIGIGVYGHVTKVYYLNLVKEDVSERDFNISHTQWLPLVILVLLSFFGHCGIRVLPWILIGEIYTHQTRAVGCGLGSACYYVFGFLANKIFLSMIILLTLPGIYYFYGVVSIFGLIVLYFVLPETEGKTLQEIINHFSGFLKLSNKVNKKP